MRHIASFTLLVATAVMLIAVPTGAQVVDGAQTLPPFGSFSGSDFDVVALQNGNLHISIPIFSVNQRDGRISYVMVYDSPTFTTIKTPETDPQGRRFTVTTVSPAAGGTAGGWRVASESNPASWFVHSSHTVITCGAGSGANFYQNWLVQDPDGVSHPLDISTGSCGGPTVVTASSPTVDGSGMFVSVTQDFSKPGGAPQAVITLKDGTKVTPPSKIEDSNGNFISTTVDNLGRPVPTTTNGPLVSLTTPLGKTIASTPQYQMVSYTDSNGSTQSYRIDFAAIDIHTAFASFDCSSNCNDFTGQFIVPAKLTLPNGKFYQFNWVNADAGELSSVSLPTGGSIAYTYDENCLSDIGTPASDCRAALISRTVTSSGVSSTWTYTGLGSGFVVNPSTATVTDPIGNDEVHTFGTVTAGTTTSNNTVEKSISKYFGSSSTGKLLLKTTTDYTGEAAMSAAGLPVVNNIRPIRKTTTLDNGLVRKTETDYETFTFVEGTSTLTATRLNPVEVRDYGYASGAPGALLRRTDYTYLHTGNSAYANLNIVDRPASVTTYDGTGTKIDQTTYEYDVYNHTGMPGIGTSGAIQHDSARGTTYYTRGNVTAVNHWLNTTGALLTTLKQYDDAGNLIATKDPKGNLTSYDYTDSWSNTACTPSGQGKAYPTTVTNALGQLAKFTYNSCTGTRASSKNQNDINASRTGTTYTYDLFNRSVSVSFPDGGQNSNCYTDVGGTGCTQTGPPFQLVSTQKINSSVNKITTTVFDGLGRVSQTQLNSDPDGATFVDTTYDAVGNVHSVSNPYRSASSPTDGITTYVYDPLRRVCVMAPPDGAVPPGTSCPAAQPTNDVFTLYSGNTTTVTDQAGKSRKSVTDALGRLMQVFEGPSGLNYETDYAYDVLSNLLTVNQQGGSTNSANWRTRTFTYDSLSRLLTTSNPESGNITYTYDNDGNVHTKTDARNIATTYNYDALNRLGGKSYSDGTETVYYNYDTPPGWMSDSTNVVGRLANTSNSSGGSADGKATAATYSYDAMGRVIRNWQQTPSTSPGGSFVYQSYDLAGNVTSATNAAGVAVSYTYDAVARPTKATSSWSDAQHPATLYTVDPSVGYFPGGAIRKATLANGLTESAMYNNRLQPCRMEINSTAASFAQCTDAVPSGNLLDFNYGFNSGVSDNGNVATWSSIGNQTFTRSYVYDSVNRISTLSDTAAAQTCKGLSWTIDPWGNRTDQTVTSGTCNTFHSGAALTNNRLGSPYTYDFAGNMTYDGVHHYTYDAENHLIQVDAGATAIYIYDPSGNRVRKNSGGSWTEFFYDFSGNVTAEHNPAGWPVEYIYFGGQLIAQYRDGTTYSVFRDHLGSTRLITKLDKSVYDSLDFLPFGEQIAGDTGTTHKLTGKERDSESGLDNFGARYDSSAIGRFMSPDWSASPEPVPFADLSNPQSLNLYAYVENNPINRIDSGGHAGKESLSGTNYLILKHRDNPNDMPNIHVYDKNNNEVGELRFNGKGQSRWVGAKNLGSQIKEQVEGIARAEGYAARAIDRQAAMDAVRAGRMTGRMSEAFGWLFLIDIAVNSVREAQTRKAEPDTGWHYDALSDKTVITDVDKAAASLAVGSQIQSQNGDVWTLGSDRQWTDSQGNHLFQCHGGQDVCSTEGMT